MENSNTSKPVQQPVAFAQRLAQTDHFNTLFDSGMRLIEETSSYLDKIGRKEQGLLSRIGSVTYASEAMRLTTRLMQLASWLLLQRSANDGEITPEKCIEEKSKLNLGDLKPVATDAAWQELPLKLKELIERSIYLEKQIHLLDTGMGGHAFASHNCSASQYSNLNISTSLQERIAKLELDLVSDHARGKP